MIYPIKNIVALCSNSDFRISALMIAARNEGGKLRGSKPPFYMTHPEEGRPAEYRRTSNVSYGDTLRGLFHALKASGRSRIRKEVDKLKRHVGTLTASPSCVDVYKAFKEHMGAVPEVVLVPGFGGEVSQNEFYQSSRRIINVDIERSSVDAMKLKYKDQPNIEAYHLPIQLYDPGEKVDLLISFRFGVGPYLAKFLRKGGYIITDDGDDGNAKSLRELCAQGDFKVKAALRADNTLDIHNLEEYFLSVETDTELQKYPLIYDEVKAIVEKIKQRPCNENVVNEYLSLREEAKNMMIKKYKEDYSMERGETTLFGYVIDDDYIAKAMDLHARLLEAEIPRGHGGEYKYDLNGETILLEPLPYKKRGAKNFLIERL